MGTLPDMGVEDVKQAVQHAHEALKSWRKTSEYERAAILNKIFQSVSPLPLCSLSPTIRADTHSVRCRLTTENHEDLAQVKFDFRGLPVRANQADFVFRTLQIITAENGKPLADSRGEITYGGKSIASKSCVADLELTHFLTPSL
jgi:succinate-semialdehyde dehydrogenase/glutarate-semialdehyde dehydrogenase